METLDITESDIESNPVAVAEKLEDFARHAEGLEVEASEGFAAMIERIPRLRCMVLGSAVRALGASRKFFDRGSRTFVEEPDWNARMKAVVWIGSYSDGLPAQTTLLKVDTGSKSRASAIDELRLAARESPAVREALREMLDELERPALPS